ncbi:hypothetical protein DRH14_03665 [Candidatus Shapirobacteria bacterium]|nr:MAG: hypothetical protein DRH14_03665 [Candidatus Shapirobacteria bacterium]
MKSWVLRGLIGALAVVGVSIGLVTKYAEGTITGTVKQAILVTGCAVDVGECTVSQDGLSFTWNMGEEVYQGSVYTATVTLENKGNQDINVGVVVSPSEQFEGEVEVPKEPITVPAGGTKEIPITVIIHPAEEPGEQYTIKVDIVPATE